MRLKTFLPFFIFLPVIILLWRGLHVDPHVIPSPLIGKPVPRFQAKTILSPQKNIDQTIFLGHLSLLSIFATWCTTCIAEQSILMRVHHQFPDLVIIGLSFKDKKNKVIDWLTKYGNPYHVVINDPNGKIGIDFGVYGTPESFLIDQNGIVRYKMIGAINEKKLSMITPFSTLLRMERYPSFGASSAMDRRGTESGMTHLRAQKEGISP